MNEPVKEIRAAQITMGLGLVDVSRIKHEGRAGILFRPRRAHIPVGEPGELPPGEYWPVDGDVVIWIENEAGAAVIQKYLSPFLGWEGEENLTVEDAWTILCETPDITSPEEYPDHALITMEQLGSFMARAAPTGTGWKKVPQEAERWLLADATNGNQVLAYENGRFYNAWLEFNEHEGGWLWMDDSDSEPNPSHYMPLPTAPDASGTSPIRQRGESE